MNKDSEAFCMANQCWDPPGHLTLGDEKYHEIEKHLSERIPTPPPGGWRAYCADHIFLFGICGRWNPEEPLWQDDLISCRVDGCPGVGGSQSKPELSSILGPAGDVLNGLCIIHMGRYAIYGSPARPKYIQGRKRCHYESPATNKNSNNRKHDKSIKCQEPAIANDLCLRHVCSKYASLSEARQVLATWDEEYRDPAIASATSDTWRILAEIQAIRDGHPSGSTLPYIFSGMEMGMSLVFGVPNYRHILHWAFKHSPNEIGRCLGIEPRLVGAHIAYLKEHGYIRENEEVALPRKFCLVVRKVEISGKLVRHWKLTNVKHKVWSILNYYPGYVIQRLPKNLPKKGEVHFVPVLEGAGIVEIKYQGRCWEITDNGQAGLRQWRQDESDRRRQDLAERGNRRLARIGVGVGAMALISIIADADQAWMNVQAFIHWLGTVVP